MKHWKASLLAGPCLAATTPALSATPLGFNTEHTAYSGGRGSRSVGTFDAVLRMSQDTKVILAFGGGQRRVQGNDTRALRASATLSHDWSSRLSTRTSLELASNGELFAHSVFGQDVSYRLTRSVTATAGGKYSSWAGGDHVTAWSAGASYYLPGLSASYRYSLLDSSKLGGSHTHLASLRISDPHGSGSTQLWAGAGSSLYDVNPQLTDKTGSFRSITVRREQPIGHGVSVSAGLGRSWFKAPTGNYRATSLLFGINVVPARPRLRGPATIEPSGE